MNFVQEGILLWLDYLSGFEEQHPQLVVGKDIENLL